MDPVELKCPLCGVGEAQSPHPCPYKCEINDDADTLCECCEACEQECTDDI